MAGHDIKYVARSPPASPSGCQLTRLFYSYAALSGVLSVLQPILKTNQMLMSYL